MNAVEDYDLRNAIQGNRLVGLWRLMTGYRLPYMGATATLAVSAVAKTVTYLVLRYFVDTAARLGPKLGALLFQLPPSLKQDLPLLDAFLENLPPDICAAFEFRHGSWLNEDPYGRLQARNLALCVADSETMATPVKITADYAYFRLRDEGYTGEDLRAWAHDIRDATSGCRDVFVYFKHEEAGKGPQFARIFLDSLAAP